MRSHCPKICDPAAIDTAASMNLPGRVELLRAERGGVLNMVEPGRDGQLPIRVMEKSARPVLGVDR